jgi:hypothetical protein
MQEEERDLVTFTDDDGNEFDLEVLDYVFYQGEEYAVMVNPQDEEDCGHEHGEDCDHAHDGCDCDECEGHEQEVYIMKVVKVGEDMEEFVPIDEEIADTLIEIVQTRFEGDFDAEDEYDENADDDEDEE